MKPKLTALVIDDDPTFLKAIQFVLESFGLMCIGTTNPETFMKKAAALKPDLVLVDLNINSAYIGFQLIESFRKRVSNKIPIIVMTGSTDPKAVSYAMEAGATDFLNKTIDKVYLGKKLSCYINTDELSTFRGDYHEVTPAYEAGEIKVDCEIELIDELGVTLRTTHLFSNGTELVMAGEIFKEVTGSDAPVKLTVQSNLLDSSLRYYSTFAEFDLKNKELMSSVRIWLEKRTETNAPSLA